MKRRKLTKQERESIWLKMNSHCGYCGGLIQLKDMQVDHIEPLYNGGSDTLDNMICSCRSCNHYKGTLTLEKFRKQISDIPKVLERNNITYQIGLRYELLITPALRNIKFYFETLDKE